MTEKGQVFHRRCFVCCKCHRPQEDKLQVQSDCLFFIWVFLWTLRGSRFKVFVFFFVIWVYYSLLQMAPTSKSKLQICHFSLFLSLLFIFCLYDLYLPSYFTSATYIQEQKVFPPCLSNIGQQSLSHLGIVLILRKNLKRDSRCLSASTSRSTVPHATQS